MTAGIDFRTLEYVDKKEWEQLTQHAVNPYYINQEYEYAKIMECGGVSPIYFLSIEDSTGKITYGMVLYSTKTRLGEILTSNGGPILADRQSSLLNEGLQRFVKEYRHKFLNIRIAFLPPSNLLNGTTILNVVRPAMTSIVDLTGNIDEIWKKVEKSRQRRIKKAKNYEIEVKELSIWDQWKESYDLQSLHASKKGYPLYYTDNMWRMVFGKYSSTGKRVTFGAYVDDKMIGTIGLTIIKGRATMDVLSDITTGEVNNVSSLLMWRAIEYSKNIHCKSFNLSGLPASNSELRGLRIFKQSFGGAEIPIEEYCSNSIFSFVFNTLRHPEFSTIVNRSFNFLGLNSLYWKAKAAASQMPIADKNTKDNK